MATQEIDSTEPPAIVSEFGIRISVLSVLDAPLLDPKPIETDEDTAVILSLDAGLFDIDTIGGSSEQFGLVIQGLPSGSQLEYAGVRIPRSVGIIGTNAIGDETWSLDTSIRPLSNNLIFIPPENWSNQNQIQKYLSVKDTQYLKWAIKHMVGWKRVNEIENIIHIHGDKDPIFPIKKIKNCIVVPGGTHIMLIVKFKWLNDNLPCIINGDYNE